jgi:hypothetical protein
MSAYQTTYLDVSYNRLTGEIPAVWGNRTAVAGSMQGFGWSDVNFAYNTFMCGLLPTWMYTRFGGGDPSILAAKYAGEQPCCKQNAQTVASMYVTAGTAQSNSLPADPVIAVHIPLSCCDATSCCAYVVSVAVTLQCCCCAPGLVLNVNCAVDVVAGTRITSSCVPPVYQSFLDVVNLAAPIAGSSINLVLRSFTSYDTMAGSTWDVYMQAPAATEVVRMGSMSPMPAPAGSAENFWNFTIPGGSLTAVWSS